MKSTKLALVIILLCGGVSACKPEPAVPVVETPAPMAEPAVTPAPAPAVDPAITDPAMTPVPPPDAPPADAAEDGEDTPHSGGDKVGAPPKN